MWNKFKGYITGDKEFICITYYITGMAITMVLFTVVYRIVESLWFL